MNSILIDTDVILDFFFDRKPFSDDASAILSLCENKKIKGFITPVMISNIYYILRKLAKHEKVIENLKSLINIIDVAIISRESILEALNSDFKDFEDAIQFYTALESSLEAIITRNKKDFKNNLIPVFSAKEYLNK